MIRTTSSRARKPVLAALGLGVAATTVLAGCTDGGGGGDNGGTDSRVSWGASAAEYQEALADMDPIEIVFQSGNTSEADHRNGPYDDFFGMITEYSGGKITFDITYAYGIVSNVLDFDDALVDGRIDMSFFWPQYDPSEYPASNLLLDVSVLRDPSFVPGYYASMAASQEIGFQTPEVIEEWAGKGIMPLNVMSTDGMTLLSCREPWTALDDLRGKQVRSGGTVHSTQLEAIGMVPVSLPYPEVYEALQRGILDCALSAHEVSTDSGWIEVAPYMLHTTTESFASTPTNFYVGPRILDLPQEARQLFAEAMFTFSGKYGELRLQMVKDRSFPGVAENGGEWLTLDPEVDSALAEINAEILDSVRASSLLDGEDLVNRSEAAYAKWLDRMEELGLVDGGPMSEFDSWFTTSPDSSAWTDAVVADILAEYSPI